MFSLERIGKFNAKIHCLLGILGLVNKKEFTDRLVLAGNSARKFAETLDYVKVKLPNNMVFTLQEYNDQRGHQSKDRKLKFLGGRFLDPSELRCLSAERAAALLWVDGQLPAWINVNVINYTADSTEIFLLFSKSLVAAEERKLPPDYGMEPNNLLVPFRIRGPWMQDWIKKRKNEWKLVLANCSFGSISHWFRRFIKMQLKNE